MMLGMGLILIIGLVLTVCIIGGVVIFIALKSSNKGEPERIPEQVKKGEGEKAPSSNLSSRRKGLSRVHTSFDAPVIPVDLLDKENEK